LASLPNLVVNVFCSEISPNRSLESVSSLHQSPTAVAGSLSSIYPHPHPHRHHSASNAAAATHPFKTFPSHLIPHQNTASAMSDLRSRLQFIDEARSAFSCVVRPPPTVAAVTQRDPLTPPITSRDPLTSPTSRDHPPRRPAEPEVDDDVTRAPVKPRIWCIADVATTPDISRGTTSRHGVGLPRGSIESSAVQGLLL